MKLLEERTPTGDRYYFPYEEGKTYADVSVAVQWGPYQDGAIRIFHRPFATGTPTPGSIHPMPDAYTGRTHAKNYREAKRIATAFFTHSLYCLRLDHRKCASEYGGYKASLADWPDAPKCECECHAS